MERLKIALECQITDLFLKSEATAQFPDLEQNLPVLVTAAGNVAGAFHLKTDAPIGVVKRPPGISNSSHVCAVYISGNSMSPEHRHGDLRFAYPRAQASISGSVIVQTQNHPQNTFNLISST